MSWRCTSLNVYIIILLRSIKRIGYSFYNKKHLFFAVMDVHFPDERMLFFSYSFFLLENKPSCIIGKPFFLRAVLVGTHITLYVYTEVYAHSRAQPHSYLCWYCVILYMYTDLYLQYLQPTNSKCVWIPGLCVFFFFYLSLWNEYT